MLQELAGGIRARRHRGGRRVVRRRGELCRCAVGVGRARVGARRRRQPADGAAPCPRQRNQYHAAWRRGAHVSRQSGEQVLIFVSDTGRGIGRPRSSTSSSRSASSTTLPREGTAAWGLASQSPAVVERRGGHVNLPQRRRRRRRDAAGHASGGLPTNIPSLESPGWPRADVDRPDDPRKHSMRKRESCPRREVSRSAEFLFFRGATFGLHAGTAQTLPWSERAPSAALPPPSVLIVEDHADRASSTSCGRPSGRSRSRRRHRATPLSPPPGPDPQRDRRRADGAGTAACRWSVRLRAEAGCRDAILDRADHAGGRGPAPARARGGRRFLPGRAMRRHPARRGDGNRQSRCPGSWRRTPAARSPRRRGIRMALRRSRAISRRLASSSPRPRFSPAACTDPPGRAAELEAPAARRAATVELVERHPREWPASERQRRLPAGVVEHTLVAWHLPRGAPEVGICPDKDASVRGTTSRPSSKARSCPPGSKSWTSRPVAKVTTSSMTTRPSS